MTSEGPPTELAAENTSVPGYEYPEDAVRAIALATRYGRWRGRADRTQSTPARMDRLRAAAIISEELARESGWLSPARVFALLGCYGLPLPPTRLVADTEAAVTAAAELCWPVALKASATGLLHNTDAGGAKLALRDARELRAAAAEIEIAVRSAGHEIEGLIVQPMVPSGVELIVGVVNDHSFGPVLACGAGGATAELVKDLAVRITPLSDADASEMLRSLRTFPLLDGYRGAPRCDLVAIEDVLLRVSAMVTAHPEIAELDCNPLIAGPDGALIVNARVRVEAAPAAAPVPSLGA
jgi:acyl-CoA synthetase (NDP forming)